jgi:hypothetical protein
MTNDFSKYILARPAAEMIEKLGFRPKNGTEVPCGRCGVNLIIGPNSKMAMEQGFVPVCNDCGTKIAIEQAGPGAELVVLIPPRTEPER